MSRPSHVSEVSVENEPEIVSEVSVENEPEILSLDQVRKLLQNNWGLKEFTGITATPLHDAVESGDVSKVRVVIGEGKCNINCTDSIGWTPLHYACAIGNLEMVKLLVDSNSRVTIQDVDGRTAVMLAAVAGHTRIVHILLSEFRCLLKTRDESSRALIHYASGEGHVSLVKTLIQGHNVDANAIASSNRAPLHFAATNSKDKVALALINDYGSDTSIVDSDGWSLLHCACKGGGVKLVKALIEKHSADINAKNNDNNTPLHIAAINGRDEVSLLLINEFHSDTSIKGCEGWSLLHFACQGGSVTLVQTLIQKHSADIEATNYNMDTPLHICTSLGHVECVKTLLHVNASVMERNFWGKTPLDIADNGCRLLLNEYIADHKAEIQRQYLALQRDIMKYSRAENLTRILVSGNRGAGKSSLIEALKKDGLFDGLKRISEITVPPHTAGIIPTTHQNKLCGRLLFYDFAGDQEYYSSHAAILENLSSSHNGDNIFIIVVDLTKDDEKIESTLHYWVSFIQHQKGSQSLICVGSHLDQITDTSKKLEFVRLCEGIQERQSFAYFMLDCCKPKTKVIGQILKHIASLIKDSPCYRLSREARILLRLLDKDFEGVTACTLEDLTRHFEVTSMPLPSSLEQLHPFIHELHEIGRLLMIETTDSLQIVLKVSELTNRVHQSLFSAEASIQLRKRLKNDALFNIGIIPERILTEVLPVNITKEYLIYLQYCQEINHREVNAFPPLRECDSTDQTFLFFPALISASKGDVLQGCSIGWLARCNSHNYFPPRFLHVLLLRLVFRFTLQVPEDDPHYDYFNRCCKMWTTGIQWRGKEGVECMVELVRDSKEVVVITKSDEDKAESRIKVLNAIIRCVMEAQVEFCHSMKPQCFLLDSTEDSDYLNEDNLFSISEMKEFLTSPPQEGKALLSKTREKEMKREKIMCLYMLTHWYSFFPLDHISILNYLKYVTRDIKNLGLHLGLQSSVLDDIDKDFPSDCDRRRREVVKRWINSTDILPCWWHLTKALREIQYPALADKIVKDHRQHIQLQEKLLSKATQPHRPHHQKFLEPFAGVVGTDWSSLAVSLSLGSSIIQEVKREGGEKLSSRDHAYRMLERWAAREDATYGQLCTALKAIPLFLYGKHQ